MDENQKRGLSLKEYIVVLLIFALLAAFCVAFSFITIRGANQRMVEAQAKNIEIALMYGNEIGQSDISGCLNQFGVNIQSGVFSYDSSTGKVFPGELDGNTVLVFDNGILSIVR